MWEFMKCAHFPVFHLLMVIVLVAWFPVAARAEFPVYTGPESNFTPMIDGDLVAWTQDVSGDKNIVWKPLLSTGEPQTITGTYDQVIGGVDGNNVVYSDTWPRENNGIWTYDVTTQAYQQVYAGSASYPRMDDSVVVWTQSVQLSPSESTNTIRYHDLATGAEGWVYDQPGQYCPDVSGNRAVYRQWNYGNDLAEVWSKTIGSGPATRLATSGDWPRVDGDYAVWQDYRDWPDGSNDIYARNLLTGEEIPIATGPANQEHPDISGTRVVWQESGKIEGYDLATGERFTASDSGTASYPAISGDNVVWRDDRNDTPDIYGTVIGQEAGPPKLQFPISGEQKEWVVRNAQDEDPPDENHNDWSDDAASVWTDDQGLHLRIREVDDEWKCAQVRLPDPLGWGAYRFKLASNTELFDPQTVVGLFLYEDKTHEIDIEMTGSFWGSNNHGHSAEYGLQPGIPEYRHPFRLGLTGDLSQHMIYWYPDQIAFESYHGHSDDALLDDDMDIRKWLLQRTPENAANFPSPELAQLAINFWLNNDWMETGSLTHDHELIVSAIEFVPIPWIAGIANSDFSAGELAGWTVTGAGTAEVVSDVGYEGNHAVQLTTGSPVILSQLVDTGDGAFWLNFDYQFLATTGTLDVWLDAVLLLSMDSPDELTGEMRMYSLLVTDPTAMSLTGAELSFLFDGPSGSQIFLDNVWVYAQTPVPEPATLSLLALGGLALLRRRSRVRRGGKK